MRHRNRHAWEVWRDTLRRGLLLLVQTVGFLIFAAVGLSIVPAIALLIAWVASLFGIHIHVGPGDGG